MSSQPLGKWALVPFEDVFIDATGGNPKIKQSDYLAEGSLPIIDQGAEEVGGYTDDVDSVCQVQLPAILFGDHTKKFKFLTSPFALGADGVKVLDVRSGWDKKFLFHYLTGVALPDVGYSRHFKFLKRITVPKPPIDEQRRIAAILGKADAIRRKCQQALAFADDCLRSAFLEMFGDPNVQCKWPTKSLTDVLSFRTGKLDSNAAEVGGSYPFFTCAREDYYINTYAFDCEALLLAGNNAAGEYTVKHYKGKFNAYQRTYVITTKFDEHSYYYFKSALQMKLHFLKMVSKGTSTKYLTMGIFADTKIGVPDAELQQKFGRLCESVNASSQRLRAELQEAESLFASLSQRAFRGEL